MSAGLVGRRCPAALSAAAMARSVMFKLPPGFEKKTPAAADR